MRRVISLFQGRKFRQQFPGIGVLKEQDVFVEMQCCSLAILASAHPQEQIDIFSETVLQLAALERGYTINQIAERMCVDSDFVRFICIHLKEAGYMDEHCTLTNLGKQHLQMPFTEKESDSDDSLWQAYAFAWPGTQDYLSYLRVGDLAAEQMFEIENQWGKVRIGTAGSSATISGQIFSSGFKGKVQLQRSSFPALIRRYNRLCRESSSFQKIPYREGSSVDAAEEGRVLLHCKAVIQEGNSGEILLSDGFSPNCEKLHNALRREYPQLERKLIENARSDTADMPQEIFGEEEAVPNTLQIIVEAMNAQEAQGQDLDSEQDAKAQNRKVVEGLCTAVETAFYEFAARNRLAEWQLELLRKRSKWECTNQIREWAKEIGIMSGMEQYDKLLEWPGKRRAEQLLRFDQSSDPEMSAVLCLAVAVEKSQGPTNFARLIRKKKNLLKFLSVLKTEGAKARHGEEIDGDRVCVLKKQCREVVSQLLPDLPLDQNKGKVWITSSTQKRINARVELCNRIGWETYAQLSPEIQNKLLQLSVETEPLPKNEMLMLFSQILEGVLREALQDMPSPDTPGLREILETIEIKRKQALPEEFCHTDPSYLRSALQGSKAVLKAYYLAYLYRRCQKEQSDMVPAAAEDKWAELVSWVSEVRQHTAKAALRVDRAEMKKRKDDVFAFVKIIEDDI